MSLEAAETNAFATDRTASFSGLRAGSVVFSTIILALSFWNVFFAGATHQDVSWLLTVGEKMLAGEGLYTDILETNPPFSVYLYLPMAWLGAVTQVSAETWTRLITYAWVLSCGTLALHMTKRFGMTTAEERLILVPVGIYALVLFMPVTFSQREHFAVAGALPMMVLAARWMTAGDRPAPRPGWVIAAGFGAAVAMMVKPHYALVFLLPYLLAAWSARSLRPLVGPEVIVAAAVVIAYGAALLLLHPEYVSGIVPLLLDVYRTRLPLLTLILRSDWLQLPLGLLLVATMAFVAGKRTQPLVWTLAAGALGFYVAFLVLGKGWDYHSMPGLSLTLIALALAGARSARSGFEGRGAIPAGVLLAGFIGVAILTTAYTNMTWSRYTPPARVVARLNAVIEHPAVASVTHDIRLGHPWTRSLGGTWADRVGSDWIVSEGQGTLSGDPAMEPERRDRIEAIVKNAVADKIAIWTARPPDIVMLDPEETGRVSRITGNPQFARILENYRVVHESGSARLALRSDLVPAWEAVTGASSPAAASD